MNKLPRFAMGIGAAAAVFAIVAVGVHRAGAQRDAERAAQQAERARTAIDAAQAARDAMARGRPADAVPALEQVLRARREAAELQPEDRSRLIDLGTAHRELAEAQLLTGAAAPAGENLIYARRVFDRLVARDASDAAAWRGLVQTRMATSLAARLRQDVPAALTELNGALDDARTLAKLDATSPESVDARVRLYAAASETQAQADAKSPKVLELLKEAAATAEAGANAANAPTEIVLVYLSTMARLGDHLRRSGDHGEAITVYRKATDFGEAQRARAEGNRVLPNTLGMIRIQTGRSLEAQGDKQAARAAWEAAADTLKPFAGDWSQPVHVGNYAVALMYLDRIDEARPLVDRLMAGGYQPGAFVALAREKGLVNQGS